MTFTAKNSKFKSMVESSFAKQSVMQTLDAKLVKLEPGEVDIELPYSEAFGQQHGFMHAGSITTVADSACGYAAYSLMPANSEVLTVEYKVNFLSPAIGEKFIASGRVKRAGKTITVCSAEVIAYRDNQTKVIASMLATMICVET